MSSYTNDDITVGVEEWEWEWEWKCNIPIEFRGAGGGECMYEGGEVIEMPVGGVGRFGGEEGKFVVGVPLYFVVQMRVRRGGDVMAEGRWEEIFSVVEGGDAGIVIDENQWICDEGTVGYIVSFFPTCFSPLGMMCGNEKRQQMECTGIY